MATLNLMLVDDHLLVRAGFKRLLMTYDHIAVVAEASSGEEALNLYKLHQPDIVILEIDIPGMGGIETIKRFLDKYPKAKIIVLTVHEEFIYLKRALAFGALGYLSKKSAHQTLHDAVKAVAKKTPNSLAESSSSGSMPPSSSLRNNFCDKSGSTKRFF